MPQPNPTEKTETEDNGSVIDSSMEGVTPAETSTPAEGATGEIETTTVMTSTTTDEVSAADSASSVANPVAGPAFTTVTTTVSEEVVTPAPALASVPPKKSKGWLIAVIIMAILFLGIAGVLIWFFAFYSNPNKVAYDAVHNLITAENVTMNGGVVVFEADELEVMVNIDTTSNKLPNSTTVSALILPVEDGADPVKIKLSLEAITTKDGVLYIKVDDVLASLKESLEVSGADETEEEIAMVMRYLEEFEGEWWRISVPEIIDEFDDVLGDFGDAIKDAYVCVIDASNKDNSKEMAQIYKDHQFIKVEPVQTVAAEKGGNLEPESWHQFYKVDLDKDALAGYLNSTMQSSATKETTNCISSAFENAYGGSMDLDFEEVSASDLDSIPDDLAFYLEISKFGHKLRSIRAVYEEEDYLSASLGILLGYEPAKAINAPSDSSPIMEFINEVLTDLNYSDSDLPEIDLPMNFDDEDYYNGILEI